MTPQEAIKYLEQHGYISDDVKDMCIEALKKQIPKNPIPDNRYLVGNRMCPSCKAVFMYKSTKYCGNCGQALDWSDEE